MGHKQIVWKCMKEFMWISHQFQSLANNLKSAIVIHVIHGFSKKCKHEGPPLPHYVSGCKHTVRKCRNEIVRSHTNKLSIRTKCKIVMNCHESLMEKEFQCMAWVWGDFPCEEKATQSPKKNFFFIKNILQGSDIVWIYAMW